METLKYSRYSEVEIVIDGVNVSTDLAPYLLSLTFNDKTSNEVDDITLTLDDRDGLFCDSWMPMTGDKIEVSIKCYNWNKPDDQHTLVCGIFEIDLVTESGPPSIIEIKAVSSFNSNIRRTLNNKRWQKSNLKTICSQIAQKHNLKYRFIASEVKENNQTIAVDSDNIDIDEVSQNDQSDLAFISKIADDNGYVVKVDEECLTLCSQEYLETQLPILSISRDEISNRSAGRQAFDLYKDVKASYFSLKQKKTHKATATAKSAAFKNNPEWSANHSTKKTGKTKPSQESQSEQKSYSFYANNGGGKTLVIRQKFSSQADAERVAKAQLAKKNSGEWKISGEVMGNVYLLAGTVIEITDYGRYSGLYYVESATHTIANGYKTSFTAHKSYIESQV